MGWDIQGPMLEKTRQSRPRSPETPFRMNHHYLHRIILGAILSGVALLWMWWTGRI